ncbi:MAG: xanthine dehydrogenase family protein subunit M [Alphaproteobacteria bacterium]
MKPARFDYAAADTVEEALDVLARLGDDARVLAGGQSLGALLNMRLVTPKLLLDINRVPGLDQIEITETESSTGAMVRQADALAHPGALADIPLLAAALPHVGHMQTRSRGTLGGSIAHADPSAELPLALLVAGGDIELRSKAAVRRVPAIDFFVSQLTTVRQPDELVTGLFWPRRTPRTGYGFVEFAMRGGDYALVAAAARVTVGSDGRLLEAWLGFGGVADRPMLLDISAFRGETADAQLARTIAGVIGSYVDPPTDLYASKEYRRNLVRVLGMRVLEQTIAQALEQMQVA